MRYFDHNATSPLVPAARDAWLAAAERYPGNPSSPHRLGDRADRALSEARERLAQSLGCRAEEIVWTSGATESVNTALAHLAAERKGRVLISAVEHPCVQQAAAHHFAGRYETIAVTSDGIVEVSALEACLRDEIAAVAVMAANNETGVLQPWNEIAQLARARGIPFLCDAVQWIGKLPASALGQADFVSGCSHKFGGPTGVGFLKAPTTLRPLLHGGPQEDRRRAGTENVAGVLAMAAALYFRENCATEALVRMRDNFIAALKQAVPSVRIVGEGAPRLWNTVSAIMPEARDCRQRWVVKLDKLGFAVSTGSACASGKEQPSPVLLAMGFTPEEAGRAIRFSGGWETTEDDWAALLDAVRQAVAALTA